MEKKIETITDFCGYPKRGFGDGKASWFVDYDIVDGTTALVVCGADGIGVLFLVLSGDKTEEFKKVVDKYEHFNEGIDGALGECIRYASQHKDILPNRCTIGGVFSSKLTITKN